MDRSSGFGSTPGNSTPFSDSLSLRLPYSVKLATKRKSLTHYTKGTQSPPCGGSHCLYACGFRICFTPLPGFFSPFPHGTGSLSVDHEYLALEDGPPIFRQDFSCPALLLARPDPPPNFRIRGYHPLSPAFPDRSAGSMVYSCRLFPFRSPLLGESRLISFPPATEMFQFAGFASSCLCIQHGMTLHTTLSTLSARPTPFPLTERDDRLPETTNSWRSRAESVL